jgi:hypothetical protein
MGAKPILWIVGLGLMCAGCSVVATSADVITTRVKDQVQEFRERRRNQAWAEAAWARVASEQPVAYTEDHRCGFLSGFAEQVYRGAVEPPPLPPDRYRTIPYQTPAGYRAIEEWFAGFRQGVAVAQAEGYRDYVTGPSALRALAPVPVPVPPPPLPPAPVPVPAPPGPVLPPPEPVQQTSAQAQERPKEMPMPPAEPIQQPSAQQRKTMRIRVEGMGIRVEWPVPTFSW